MSSTTKEGGNGEISVRSSNETPLSFDSGVSDQQGLQLSLRLKNTVTDRGKSRYFILAIALLFSAWSAGLIFGWAPLYSTLLRAGVYADRCPTPHPSNITSDTPDYLSNGTVVIPSAPESSDGLLCDAQQTRLNLIYTAGSAFTQASLFVSGVFLDFQGPKLTASISALVVALGAFLFGVSLRFDVDLYIVGFALMGFGGAGINLATYTVSNLFPRYKSWVVSSLVGVWTLSSLWFLLFRPAYNSGIGLDTLFFWQTGLLLITALVFFFTFPNRALEEGESFSFLQWLPWNAWSHKQHQSIRSSSIRNSLTDDLTLPTSDETQLDDITSTLPSSPSGSLDLSRTSHSGSLPTSISFDVVSLDSDASTPAHSIDRLRRSSTASSSEFSSSEDLQGKMDANGDSLDLEASPAPARSGVDPQAHSTFKAILADLMTMDFILLTIWFAVHVLFFEFCIGTIADALHHRTRQSNYPLGPADKPATQELSDLADHYVLAFNLLYAVGFVFVPLYAWTTDRLGFTGSFFLATLLAVLYPLVCALIPTLWLFQIAAYVIYSAALQFVYSCQFGFVSHRFGYNHFGVLVGVMGLVAASLIPLQPVFLRIVLKTFDGNFFWMYIIQGVVTLPLFAIVVWNWISTRRALLLGLSHA